MRSFGFVQLFDDASDDQPAAIADYKRKSPAIYGREKNNKNEEKTIHTLNDINLHIWKWIMG